MTPFMSAQAGRPPKLLTVIVYHYVRDLDRSRYPAIKGRRISEFEGQLDYIARHYNAVSFREVLAASRGERELPAAPCVLTFDDGLTDHFEVVLPRLLARGMSGAFFASARPVREGILLDVHKLHVILASCADHAVLVDELRELLTAARAVHDVPSFDVLAAEHFTPSRYDPAKTAFLKRVLQSALPAVVRNEIVDALFCRHVDVEEGTLARELYMDVSQLRGLVRNGMELGGHGDRHERIGLLSPEHQRAELCATRRFLESVDPASARDWIMCFPYGSFSPESLTIAAQIGCAAALSVRPALVQLPLVPRESSVPVVDRLDTNDLPVTATAPSCEWTARTRV